MFEDAAIVRFYYYMENGSKLMKIKYSCDENGNVSLGDIVEVRVAYEEVVEVSNTATEVEEVGVENATESIKEDEEEKESKVVEEKDEKEEEEFVKSDEEDKDEEEDTQEDSTEDPEEDKDDEDDDDKVVHAACGEVEQPTADAADVSDAEFTETEMKVSEGNEQISTEEKNTSSASFTDSERAEFETLKREKKVTLLESYKEVLEEEEYNKFLGSIDSFEEKDLELELLKIYKKQQQEEPKTTRAFLFAPLLKQKNNDKDSLDDFIRNNL